MASRNQINEVKIDVVGTKVPKFKAGSELSPTVNSFYIDTNEGSQDGSDYDYSVMFTISTTIEDVTP